jgi:hypothetical protein
MPVRTRRMKSSGKGVRLPEGSFSSDEDTEISPPAKSMVDELKSYILLQILDDQRVESFEKLEECLEKLQHSLVHLMKNDLTQELKLGGQKMPYDFNLEKTDFSLENNDQFTKDDEESETKSMK